MAASLLKMQKKKESYPLPHEKMSQQALYCSISTEKFLKHCNFRQSGQPSSSCDSQNVTLIVFTMKKNRTREIIIKILTLSILLSKKIKKKTH